MPSKNIKSMKKLILNLKIVKSI